MLCGSVYQVTRIGASMQAPARVRGGLLRSPRSAGRNPYGPGLASPTHASRRPSVGGLVYLHRALGDSRGPNRSTALPIHLRHPGSPIACRARVVHREGVPRSRAGRDGADDRLADLGLGNRLRRVPVRLVVSGVGLLRGTLRPRMQNVLDLPSIEAARKRIEGLVVRTPLVRLNVDDAPAEIYLKLENLQPTGSFKVRGAGNSIALLTPEQRSHGVFTCSAGNMAQALAWHARRLGIPCTAIVPDTAPATTP